MMASIRSGVKRIFRRIRRCRAPISMPPGDANQESLQHPRVSPTALVTFRKAIAAVGDCGKPSSRVSLFAAARRVGDGQHRFRQHTHQCRRWRGRTVRDCISFQPGPPGPGTLVSRTAPQTNQPNFLNPSELTATSQFAEANHPESHATCRIDRARGQNFSIF
jgi:hypothetical protein